MSKKYTVEQGLLDASERFDESGIYCGHGTDNNWDEACVLLLHAFGLQHADESILSAPLTGANKEKFDSLVAARIEDRVPAAYLVGESAFAGLRFSVDERVLVPRSPIAELIENSFEPWLKNAPDRILDLCTGSGCIGIASAVHFPLARVTLADLSLEALEVARANVARHQLESRCEILCGDLFASLRRQSFDLIVSNPPYVDQADLESMPVEYHREPVLGLAAGADGLDLVRSILRDAGEHLNPDGHLIVEVGNSWQALEQVYTEVPFTWIEFENGGEGVFILTKDELSKFQDSFEAAYNHRFFKG